MALATDFDGTIAHDGVVDAATLAALERLRGAARRLILVTGRELDDLQRIMPRLDVFDRVVAENGALLYRPATKEERALVPPPDRRFVERLRQLGVDPLSVGRSIVATWEPNETKVLHAIQELGMELSITFNKGAVMVLPAGVNKASGLAVALDELDLAPLNAVAVGDAENDMAFLDIAGCAVAVANATEALKERVAWVRRASAAKACRSSSRGCWRPTWRTSTRDCHGRPWRSPKRRPERPSGSRPTGRRCCSPAAPVAASPR